MECYALLNNKFFAVDFFYIKKIPTVTRKVFIGNKCINLL